MYEQSSLEEGAKKVRGKTIARVRNPDSASPLTLTFIDGTSLDIVDTGTCHCDERAHRPLPSTWTPPDEAKFAWYGTVADRVRLERNLIGRRLMDIQIASDEQKRFETSQSEMEDARVIEVMIVTDGGIEMLQFWNGHEEDDEGRDQMEIVARLHTPADAIAPNNWWTVAWTTSAVDDFFVKP